MDALTMGLNAPDFALALNRITLGLFFVLARFRFFYDPARGGNLPSSYPVTGTYGSIYGNQYYRDRRAWFNPRRAASLTRKMCTCGWRKGAAFWAWFAAIVEVGAGLFLIFGLLSALSAFGLLTVTTAATFCTAKEKVTSQKPIDKIDCVGCYLWCAEPLYIVMALVAITAGPGSWSLDALLWS